MAKAQKTAPLSEKQLMFAQEYVKDHNATQAAIRAGYSEKGADVQGSRLLGDVRIQAQIHKAHQAISKRNEVTVDRVVQELKAIAFATWADAFDEQGNLLPVHAMPDHMQRAITQVDVKSKYLAEGLINVQLTQVKMGNKLGALVELMKYLGAYDKHNAQIKPDAPLMAVPDDVLRKLLPYITNKAGI